MYDLIEILPIIFFGSDIFEGIYQKCKLLINLWMNGRPY